MNPGWRPSRSSATPMRAQGTSAWPTARSALARRRRRRATCRIDAIVEAAIATGADAIHPGLRLPGRAGRVRARRGGCRDRVHRAAIGRDRRLGRQAPCSTDRSRRRCRHRAGDARTGVGRPAGPAGRGARRGRGGSATRCWSRPRPVAVGGHAARGRLAPSCRRPWPLDRREAASAFGDGSVYLEREISPARHVEVQLLGDADGSRGRDRGAGLLAPATPPEARGGGAGARVWPPPTGGAARACHPARPPPPGSRTPRQPSSCGTRTATSSSSRSTRDSRWSTASPSSSPGSTSSASNLDLAAGRPLSPEALAAAAAGAADPTSHAIEVRITAEDPGPRLQPDARAAIRHWVMPSGPGVRVDTAFEAGDRVPPDYDNLIAKIMVHAAIATRPSARLRRALDETEIGGIQTTLPFHRFVARSASFAAGRAVDRLGGGVAGTAGGSSEARLGSRQLAAGLDALEAAARLRAGPDRTGRRPAATPAAPDADGALGPDRPRGRDRPVAPMTAPATGRRVDRSRARSGSPSRRAPPRSPTPSSSSRRPDGTDPRRRRAAGRSARAPRRDPRDPRGGRRPSRRGARRRHAPPERAPDAAVRYAAR